MPVDSLRSKSFLNDHFTLLLAGLLTVALVGGYITVGAYTNNSTIQEEQTAGTWTTSTDFSHSAVVKRNATVFAAGERLVNRSVYIKNLMPELSSNYTITHHGADEPAVVTTEIRLVRRSVRSSGAEYWQENKTLARVEETTLQNGETLEVPFTLNVTLQEQRVDEIEATLGASPGRTEIVVVAETRIESTLNGESVSDSRTEQLNLQPSDDTYSVATEMEGTHTSTATEIHSVPVPPSPLTSYVAPVVAVIALVAAVGLIVGRRKGRLEITESERARLAYERDREEYDEWISSGSVPDKDREVVRIHDLEDLVDIAIDSNRRVIENDDSNQYVTIVHDVRYVFESPSTFQDGPLGSVAGHDVDTDPDDDDAADSDSNTADDSSWFR